MVFLKTVLIFFFVYFRIHLMHSVFFQFGFDGWFEKLKNKDCILRRKMWSAVFGFLRHTEFNSFYVLNLSLYVHK